MQGWPCEILAQEENLCQTGGTPSLSASHGQKHQFAGERQTFTIRISDLLLNLLYQATRHAHDLQNVFTVPEHDIDLVEAIPLALPHQ